MRYGGYRLCMGWGLYNFDTNDFFS